ncbi:MAG: class I SAM-dependent methyltransferase [Caldimonas sp.]
MADQPVDGGAGDSELQAYYAARAAEYDRVYDKPERQAELRMLRQRLPTFFVGARVLEVACGTGYWTQFIAPMAASVVAFDSAEETLAVARRRPIVGQVEFMIGDAYRPPVERGLFEAAFAGFWYSHVPKRRRREFLAGLGEVLMPGATVVLLDNRHVAGSSLPVTPEDAHGDTHQIRQLQDGSSYRVLKNFPTREEFEVEIAGLGLRPVFEALPHYWTWRYASDGRASAPG